MELYAHNLPKDVHLDRNNIIRFKNNASPVYEALWSVLGFRPDIKMIFRNENHLSRINGNKNTCGANACVMAFRVMRGFNVEIVDSRERALNLYSVRTSGYFARDTNELVLCNPLEYLRRDYSDKHDWQHNPQELSYLEKRPHLGKFIHEMQRYISYNVAFHAGDLYEHSVWTCLYAEELCNNFARDTSFIPLYIRSKFSDEHFKRLISTIAFFHDIGKIKLKTEVNDVSDDSRRLYIPIGNKEYFRGTRNHERYGEREFEHYFVAFEEAFGSKIDASTQFFIESLIRHHRLIGDIMMKYEGVCSDNQRTCDDKALISIANDAANQSYLDHALSELRSHSDDDLLQQFIIALVIIP
jgi:hypothetical protein